ncbi:MAG: hypothetical protein EOM20_20985, partial [Spartobacteria bacterium]|nr:hypothetical protein [Spartobacteria bacterium]
FFKKSLQITPPHVELHIMYNWRKMTEEQRTEVANYRSFSHMPHHSPPHYECAGHHRYHLTAANFEHAVIVGKSPERMQEFSSSLLDILFAMEATVYAWCVLPNHWHALVGTSRLKPLLAQVGQLHGRTSFEWNGQDHLRGRKCWCCCADRKIRNDGHFNAVRNYIHHNPVKHGYVSDWNDWSFSSAHAFVREVGRDKAVKLWEEYPILDMGQGWDDL